jgi:hypothetical protein
VSSLSDEVRRAVREDRFLFTIHADDRIRERQLVAWQIVAGVDAGKVTGEHSENLPIHWWTCRSNSPMARNARPSGRGFNKFKPLSWSRFSFMTGEA